MENHLKQLGYDIRCEWGLNGIKALLDDSDVIIIVDVLSFTTSVNIALARDAVVHPYAGNDDSAIAFAQEKDAILATKRPSTDADSAFTLSPSSLQTLPNGAHIVLPSPNGSTLSTATGDVMTLAGCLRNACAVAEFAQSHGQRISVIPAGERFFYSRTDSALRPSLEDWIGAGAIISYLQGQLSPEAHTAKLVYEAHCDTLQAVLSQCVSGVELIDKDHANDVILASQVNVNTIVPQLIDGAYQHCTQ